MVSRKTESCRVAEKMSRIMKTFNLLSTIPVFSNMLGNSYRLSHLFLNKYNEIGMIILLRKQVQEVLKTHQKSLQWKMVDLVSKMDLKSDWEILKTMLLFPTVLGACSGQFLMEQGQEEFLEINFIRIGDPLKQGSFSSLPQRRLGELEVRFTSACGAENPHGVPVFAGILLTLGSSKFTHPLFSQSQKAKISWLNRRMDHRWQRFKKKKKIL